MGNIGSFFFKTGLQQENEQERSQKKWYLYFQVLRSCYGMVLATSGQIRVYLQQEGTLLERFFGFFLLQKMSGKGSFQGFFCQFWIHDLLSRLQQKKIKCFSCFWGYFGHLWIHVCIGVSIYMYISLSRLSFPFN